MFSGLRAASAVATPIIFPKNISSWSSVRTGTCNVRKMMMSSIVARNTSIDTNGSCAGCGGVVHPNNSFATLTSSSSSLLRSRLPTFAYTPSSSSPSSFGNRIQFRHYTPMTKEEEEQEKARVSHLSPEEKDAELRKLNREIAKLETLKGINTGELYTWSGRYKALTREYGFPLMVYYFSVWATSGVCLYLGLDIFGIDAMQLLERIDMQLGWSLSSKVDPELGKLGMVLVLNEMLEPIRLPFVIVTLKPVMDQIAPPKY